MISWISTHHHLFIFSRLFFHSYITFTIPQWRSISCCCSCRCCFRTIIYPLLLLNPFSLHFLSFHLSSFFLLTFSFSFPLFTFLLLPSKFLFTFTFFLSFTLFTFTSLSFTFSLFTLSHLSVPFFCFTSCCIKTRIRFHCTPCSTK